uniref:Neuraminidase n=1 Tax=Siamese algae-eater influenza-like virus TaxID=2777035 RepID=A0A866VZH7_9ORTO|nr:neuraminidase [Siamese algae-eater influenza-like virus]
MLWHCPGSQGTTKWILPSMLLAGLLGVSSYLVYSHVSLRLDIAAAVSLIQNSGNQSSCAAPNPVTVLNQTTVVINTLPVSTSPTYFQPRMSCTGTRFQPFMMMNSPRYGGTGDRGSIHLNREPFVSCSMNECRHFALGHTATQNGPYSAGTGADRSIQRMLFSTKLGEPFTIDNAIVHMSGWSGSACHDGVEWTYVTVFGTDPDALVKTKYGNNLVDSYRSFAGNILRTQESECVCLNGSCYVMITDGYAGGGGVSQARFLVMKQGKIIDVINTSGRSKFTEECTCAATGNTTIMCACRDNAYTDRRPIVAIDTIAKTANVGLMCSPTRMDTPRSADSAPSSCNVDDGTGGGGVKGGFAVVRRPNGNQFYYTRTGSASSRVGMEVRGPQTEDPMTGTSAIPLLDIIVSTSVNTGYSSSFEMKGIECDTPCFVVEHIRSNTWTTASSSIYCLSGDASMFQFDDGVNPTA